MFRMLIVRAGYSQPLPLFRLLSTPGESIVSLFPRLPWRRSIYSLMDLRVIRPVSGLPIFDELGHEHNDQVIIGVSKPHGSATPSPADLTYAILAFFLWGKAEKRSRYDFLHGRYHIMEKTTSTRKNDPKTERKESKPVNFQYP